MGNFVDPPCLYSIILTPLALMNQRNMLAGIVLSRQTIITPYQCILPCKYTSNCPYPINSLYQPSKCPCLINSLYSPPPLLCLYRQTSVCQKSYPHLRGSNWIPEGCYPHLLLSPSHQLGLHHMAVVVVMVSHLLLLRLLLLPPLFKQIMLTR